VFETGEKRAGDEYSYLYDDDDEDHIDLDPLNLAYQEVWVDKPIQTTWDFLNERDGQQWNSGTWNK
jgi:hypothetical protein